LEIKLGKSIKILFIGDIVGDNGLDFVVKSIPHLKSKYSADVIIANGENIWQGKGLNEDEAKLLFDAGVRVITTGNHIWDNWKSRPLLATNDNVLRPANYPWGNPGKGYTFIKFEDIEIAVVQIQGRTFMQTIDCPFRAMDTILKQIGDRTKLIFVDFHAEATAEKVSMGWYLDGKVSALMGTHTHIQTADAQIFPRGMAYISDVGMSGSYNSVLGMDKDIAIKRFLLQTAHKFELAEGDYKVSGACVTIDSTTGLAEEISPFVYPEFVNKAVY
jgi:hypothetical protein